MFSMTKYSSGETLILILSYSRPQSIRSKLNYNSNSESEIVFVWWFHVLWLQWSRYRCILPAHLFYNLDENVHRMESTLFNIGAELLMLLNERVIVNYMGNYSFWLSIYYSYYRWEFILHHWKSIMSRF